MAILPASAWWPRFLHTALLGLLGVLAYKLTHDSPLAIAIVVAGSSILGEVVARTVAPKKHTPQFPPVPVPLTPEYLAGVQREVHEEVYRLVTRLSVWRAEVDFAIDETMRKLTALADAPPKPTEV